MFHSAAVKVQAYVNKKCLVNQDYKKKIKNCGVKGCVFAPVISSRHNGLITVY